MEDVSWIFDDSRSVDEVAQRVMEKMRPMTCMEMETFALMIEEQATGDREQYCRLVEVSSALQQCPGYLKKVLSVIEY